MRPTRADIILIAALLLCATIIGGVLIWMMPHGAVAVITINGQETLRLPLTTDTIVHLDEGYTIVVRQGTIGVQEAPCPDLICVHTPPASRAGETIVCLPGKLVITVEGA